MGNFANFVREVGLEKIASGEVKLEIDPEEFDEDDVNMHNTLMMYKLLTLEVGEELMMGFENGVKKFRRVE